MADALTIENTKEQQLEIELTVQGVDALKETKVCFCIETDGMTLCFDGVQGESDTWKFDIPVLSQLKRTSYDYKVVVVTDGYHFEPATGIVTIVGPRDIYTSAPKNVTLEPKKAEKKKFEPEMVATDKKDDKKVEKAEEKVVKKEEVKAEKKIEPKKVKFSKTDPQPKNLETKKGKKDKKKTAESTKPTFKSSIITETFGKAPDVIEAKPVETKPIISEKDETIKKLLAEVEQKNKDEIVRKAFAEATTPKIREVVKVEPKGDRKVIEFVNASLPKKTRFKEMALTESVEPVVKTEKDEEVLNILRDVKPEAAERKPTVLFKKGKVVN